nr:MAG TPA: hypothetical protein [Caudoviricetes sp.]
MIPILFFLQNFYISYLENISFYKMIRASTIFYRLTND